MRRLAYVVHVSDARLQIRAMSIIKLWKARRIVGRVWEPITRHVERQCDDSKQA